WLEEYERRGGGLVVEEAGVEDLVRYGRGHELLGVAAGQGEAGGLFSRQPQEAPFEAPAGGAAPTVVRRVEARSGYTGGGLERILAQADDPFDERWMQQTFDRYWRGYAQWVVSWTNAVLAPPQPHVVRLLEAAQEVPAMASTIANGFDDPRTFYPWWFDEREADRLIAEKRAQTERGL